MKNEIHPQYVETKVTCGCGEVFTTRSTKENGSIYVEVCSVFKRAHPTIERWGALSFLISQHIILKGGLDGTICQG